MTFNNTPRKFVPKRDHCYIAIDWGHSSLKAYLCCASDNNGVEIIDEVQSEGMQTKSQDFADTFLKLTNKWRLSHGLLPAFIGGEIGSHKGWVTTDLVSCPVAPADMVSAQIEFECEGQLINVLPGLVCHHSNGDVDKMRGEEIQVLGWLQASASHRNGIYLLCLPSTHSKWILVKDGIIQTFTSSINAELFDLLSDISVLDESNSERFSLSVFDLASNLTTNLTTKQSIASFTHDHSQESRNFCSHLSPTGLSLVEQTSYHSGMLIGLEVSKAMQSAHWDIKTVDEIILIGECHISSLFERAIRARTNAVRSFHAKQACVLGFAAIRQRYIALQMS